MQGFLSWGAFTVVVAASCVWAPQAARIFVGRRRCTVGGCRGIGASLSEPSPLAFGIFVLTFETVAAALTLSRGRALKRGLIAAIVFLIGITPLGLEEPGAEA